MPQLIILILAVYGLYSCSSDVDSDGLLKLDRYEEVEVNVIFYFENRAQDYFLGTVMGASRCGSVARSYAYEKNVENTDWSYICITTDGQHKIR